MFGNQSSRTKRLSAIQKLLTEHSNGLTTKEVAERLGVTRSTIHRDFVSLSDSLPLWEDKSGRIGIFPPLNSEVELIISLGESTRLEFKRTACWNAFRGIKDHTLVENVVRSVVGFMNSKGGLILIGVDNDGHIVGLDDDLKTADSTKPNKDGYELFLRNSINSFMSGSAITFYDIEFVRSRDDKDICKIAVRESSKPMYFKGMFYVRNGNQTRLLTTQEAVDYISEKWLHG